MANHLRVQLVKTKRTDLVCIHCGFFGTSAPMLAIVAPQQDSENAQAGVHRKCIPLVKARPQRRPTADTVPCAPPSGGDVGGAP